MVTSITGKDCLSPANAPAAPGLPRPGGRGLGRVDGVDGPSITLYGGRAGAHWRTRGVTEGTSTLGLLPTWVAGSHPLWPALHLRHRPGPPSTLRRPARPAQIRS